GVNDAVAAAAAANHSLALLSDGTMRAWGWNLDGQLGIGSRDQQSTPVKVTGIEDAESIAAGGSSSYAIRADGSVWRWGSSAVGNVSHGPDSLPALSPIKTKTLTNVFTLAAGNDHCLAVAR
ncbi:MAG: RCC1 domain-containing protein, partial [Planctomycetota bacterium]